MFRSSQLWPVEATLSWLLSPLNIIRPLDKRVDCVLGTALIEGVLPLRPQVAPEGELVT